ncbi:MAG: hypothetical protein QOH84_2936 [Kribbellaceae bacterium]|nr:hypothetical protein [Kribbellaceae bacterium]
MEGPDSKRLDYPGRATATSTVVGPALALR